MSKVGFMSKISIVVQKVVPIAHIKQLSMTQNFDFLYATMISSEHGQKRENLQKKF